jgi:type IX secretion system PorP/SprF family membrane protein
MMNRRIIVTLALLTAMMLKARAQWDVQFSDYTALKSYYNPAVSGTDGKLNVAATYTMQMVGYDDAPATIYVGADMPVYFLSPRHGGGVSFFNDNSGMFTTTRISLQYAYNIKVSKNGRLAIGIQGAMMSEKMDPKGTTMEDNSDPAVPSTDAKGNKVDMGTGLYYYHPRMWLGISSQHLLAPTILLERRYEVEVPRMYYLMGGCNIKLRNSLLSLQPSFLVQSDMDKWREDVQCKVVYERDEKKFYGGVGYSPNTSVTFLLGGMFHGVNLGYSYQMYTSGMGLINGSHELVVGYLTDLDLFKKGRNKHQSVRWL